MNARQIEVFEAIMRSGSLASAARALGVSQPAVSKSLRLAEQATGFVLFRRVRGRLYPSPEAETLLPQVARVRGELDGVTRLIRELREGGVGHVTIAAPGSVAHPFVTPAVARFRRQFPDIRVEIRILTTAAIADCVADSEADFGVVHQPTDNPYVSGEVVCEGEGICVVPRRHAFATRRTLGVRDLLKEPLICYREDTAIGRLVRKALAAADPRRDVDVVINHSQQAIDLVEAGAGLAVMDPFLMVANPRPSLVAVPFRPAFPNRLRIIRPRERPRSRAAAQLETLVRDTLLKRVARSPYAGLIRPMPA